MMKRYATTKKRIKWSHILAGIFSGAGCLVMVAFPQLALESAKKGISLWANAVLPSLLPFFICANFMIALGVPRLVGRYFERFFQRLFKTPGESAFVFIISITSGYPMGPKLIGDMSRKGQLSGVESRRMLSFCSTSGPLFMLGTVGAGMLGSASAGAVIAVSHYIGALLNGLLFCQFPSFSFLSQTDQQEQARAEKARQRQERRGASSLQMQGTLLEQFTDCILSSFQSLGVICGYIVLFTLISDFAQFFGALDFAGSEYGKSFAKGLLEMTVGCSSMSGSGLSLMWKTVFCTFLISFGGLSIMGQSVSMLSGVDLSPWYYLRTKLSHGFIAALVAYGISPFLLKTDALPTIASLLELDSDGVMQELSFLYGLLFSGKMVIMVVLLFVATIFINNLLPKKEKAIESFGIIAEYNPFHNGHLYHLKESLRLTEADYTVCVMSGDFMQRGEAALWDKWIRAEMAVRNGIDLVLELPFVFACNNAEQFAVGAVRLLDGLGCVTHLSFGSETGDLKPLQETAAVMADESQGFQALLKQYAKTGIFLSQSSLDGLFANRPTKINIS